MSSASNVRVPPCAETRCASCGGIARVVHQSWINSSVPAALLPLEERWKVAPTGWRHTLWTDESNRALWARHFPELLPMYDAYTVPVQRADASRMLYMYLFGGVYADLDVAPCDSVWTWLERAQAQEGLQLLLVRGPDPSHRKGHVQALSNFFLASAPGHPFWAWALRLLHERRNKPVMSATGPWFLNHAWSTWSRKFKKNARNSSLGGVCRAAWRSSSRVLTFDEWQAELAAHHWMGTWHHNHTIAFNPYFQDWMGVNRSRNCHEAAFAQHIARTWKCKTMKRQNERAFCQRPHWADYLNGSFCDDPANRHNPSCQSDILARPNNQRYAPYGAHAVRLRPRGRSKGRGRGRGRGRGKQAVADEAASRARLRDWAEIATGVAPPTQYRDWQGGLVDY